MSKKLKSAVAMILTLIIAIGLVPPIPVSAAADTSAVGAVIDSYHANSSTFTLRAASRLFVPGDSAPTGALLQTLQLVQRQFAADGIPTANTMDIVWDDVSFAKAGDILIYLDASSGIAPEGYSITVTDRAVVTASDVDGLLYGLNMLQKHFRTAGGNSIKGFTAADAPDTAERTVHLDIARKYLTKDWICNYIREMSWMGYNTIELHLSEDGGFRADIWDEAYFTSPNGNDFSWMVGSEEQYWCYDCEDPDQGKYLTTAELVEILQTAVEYHMDVIPSFDTPAHVDWICKNYYRNYRYSTFKYEGATYTLPEYINYRGTTSSSYFACLNLGNQTVRKFAYAVYADIAAFFKQYAGSTEFNICGDEVALKSTDSWDYADFITYVNELNGQLKEQGYTVRMYNDFIERADYTNAAGSTVPELDADIEVVYWDAPNSSSSYIRPAKYLVDDGRVVYSGVQNWTYYVLRRLNASSASSSSYYMMDARDPNNYWWSFHQNGEDTIYTGWDPTRLSEYDQTLYSYSGSQLGGGYFMVWCDYAGMSTEAEMWNGVWDNTGSRSDGKYFYSLLNRMWSSIIKMWNWDIDSTLSFSSFETLRDGFGDFPGLVSCSEPAVLPAATAPECVEHVWVDGICDDCGRACDHDYTVTETPATCVEFAKTDYSCGLCGYSYTQYHNQWSEWSTTRPEGVEDQRIETKTQYRYSDYETTTSFETELDGYTRIGGEWVKTNTGSVKYVNTWPSGFSTGSSLYSQYNQKANKVTAYENDTVKRVIDSDALCGYLYYHWCYSGSYYSTSYYTGRYRTFSAYYSTTSPSNYTCDYSDYSYNTGYGNCSNSPWYFVTNVYEQKYSDYQMRYTYDRWGDWSEWSDTPAEASATRMVETQTLYRYMDDRMGDHAWENGVCTVCKTACNHIYQSNVCTVCGSSKLIQDLYLFGYINGADYADKEDSENLGEYQFVDGSLVVFFTENSYVGVKSADNLNWYMTDGWQGYVSTVTLYNSNTLGENGDKLFIPGGTEVTFTLTDHGDDTYQLSYVAVECPHKSHSTDGFCTQCGDAVEHSYNSDGFCVCGLECAHVFESGVCTACGKECAHAYQNNVCTVCAMEKPVFDYYLFGWINGKNYGCEEDYENLGEYQLVDGKVVVLFTADSYVAVKASDNAHWYMTDDWQGMVTSATLYNTATLAKPDKLFVPGGTRVTFTLVDNGDDTYLLSYEATCAHQSHNQDGICADCGSTVSHSLQNNVCTVCGYRKPLQDLYLFGWINGKDYACEADHANLGSYKFVDGKLVAFFTSDSYVAVKSADNLKWYMTDGYQEGATSVTLVDSNTILTEDKLFVPGNLKITFTLVDNGDDTYVFSYEAVECTHESHNTDGSCTLCGSAVEHSYDHGACVCGKPCDHSWIEGTCSVCGQVCDHDWSEGGCTVCGMACSHVYQNNVCTVCGYAKPAVDYYLFGTINGEDYAWGEDAANLGEYKFVDGQLVITFRQDSYIGVKASNNAGWYMAKGDQGEAVSVTLYNTAVITDSIWLFVPGCMEITFTLVDNGDDTLSLSYTTAPCTHESHDQSGACTACGTAVGHDYESKTTDATCTEDGSIVYTCPCGDSYSEVIEATGHSYADGVCGVCGAADPDYVPPVVVPTLQLAYPKLNLEADVILASCSLTRMGVLW